MWASRAALILVVYVSLDFANPLMPGAVRLAGAALETVEAERSRVGGVERLPPAPAPTVDREVREAPGSVRLEAREAPRSRPRRPGPGTLRLPAGPPPSDPDEH
jgi:hypothetical protein